MKEVFNKLSEQWKDTASLVLGLWLIASPWALSYAAETMAAGNAWIIGAGIAVVAIAALAASLYWLEWAGAVLGTWLIVSPWVLGFGALEAAVWNQVVVGALLAGLAIWAALSDHPGRTARA